MPDANNFFLGHSSRGFSPRSGEGMVCRATYLMAGRKHSAESILQDIVHKDIPPATCFLQSALAFRSSAISQKSIQILNPSNYLLGQSPFPSNFLEKYPHKHTQRSVILISKEAQSNQVGNQNYYHTHVTSWLLFNPVQGNLYHLGYKQ